MSTEIERGSVSEQSLDPPCQEDSNFTRTSCEEGNRLSPYVFQTEIVRLKERFRQPLAASQTLQDSLTALILRHHEPRSLDAVFEDVWGMGNVDSLSCLSRCLC